MLKLKISKNILKFLRLNKSIQYRLDILIIIFLAGFYLGTFYIKPEIKPIPISTENIRVCFTPSPKCSRQIADLISQAETSLLLQAYSFTSEAIISQAINAYKRGIKVEVILDKSNLKDPHSLLPALKKAGIPVFIDTVPGIAHSKIVIIDNKIVITGSFNFSKAIDHRNAENIVIITNGNIANLYTDNFYFRKSKAKISTNFEDKPVS